MLNRGVVIKYHLLELPKVSNVEKMLNELLQNSEDMLNLMLTARAEPQQCNEIEGDLQDDPVELLLENYHRQTTLILNDIIALARLVHSKQELASISLDVQRNRMIHMNVHLTIGAVSLGVCTTVAGYFGMNLEIPASSPSFSMVGWVNPADSCVPLFVCLIYQQLWPAAVGALPCGRDQCFAVHFTEYGPHRLHDQSFF